MSEKNQSVPEQPKDNVPEPSTTEYVSEDFYVPSAPISKDTEEKSPNDRHHRQNLYVSVASLLVSAIVGAITLVLLFETKKANITATNAIAQAKKANEISENALKDARGKDSIERDNQQIIDSISNEERLHDRSVDRDNLAFWSNSLNVQTESVREMQHQFQATNVALLQFSNFQVHKLVVGQPIQIVYSQFNLGQQPAKILSGRFGYFCFDRIIVYPFRQLPGFLFDAKLSGLYLIKDAPAIHTFTSNEVISQERFDAITKGELVLMFFGEIDYVNEVTGKFRRYVFNIHFMPNSQIFRFVLNENNNIPVDSLRKATFETRMYR